MNSTAAPQWHSGTETTTPTRHRPDGVRWADGIPQPDLSPAQTRALSAAHEAGHAVIGQVRGLSLAYIALKGALGCPADTGGYTAWQADSFQHATWQAAAQTLAAGERAADRWLREAGLWTPSLGWICEYSGDTDREMASTLAQALPRPFRITWGTQPGSDADWSTVCHQADRLLTEHWHIVVAVVRHLLAHGRIDEQQFAACLPGGAR